jgi:hypothetical protein
MKELTTLTGNPFQYKRHADGELIVYPPDEKGNVQDKSAIVITPFTIGLVKDAIRKVARIKMGASRDAPPPGSLGALIKQQKQSPQQLSYLIPILVAEGSCRVEREGKAFVMVRMEG